MGKTDLGIRNCNLQMSQVRKLGKIHLHVSVPFFSVSSPPKWSLKNIYIFLFAIFHSEAKNYS
jgi:hypothetical protein